MLGGIRLPGGFQPHLPDGFREDSAFLLREVQGFRGMVGEKRTGFQRIFLRHSGEKIRVKGNPFPAGKRSGTGPCGKLDPLRGEPPPDAIGKVAREFPEVRIGRGIQ